MKTLHAKFLRLTNLLTELICSNHFSPDLCFGVNGPYNDFELPTRTYCHLLYWSSWSYEQHKSTVAAHASQIILKLLLAQRSNFNFIYPVHRFGKYPIKDVGNGLIGEAWFYEAISKYISTYTHSCDEHVIKLYSELQLSLNNYLLHERSSDPLGNISRPDGTYNHQLWKIATYLESNPRSPYYCDFYRLLSKLQLYRDGTIYHLSPCLTEQQSNKSIKTYISHLKNQATLYHKSCGYHLFVLYGFAIIQSTANLDFSTHIKLQRAIRLLSNAKYINHLFSNAYSKDYNRVEFEYPFVSRIFCHADPPPLVIDRLDQTLSLFINMFLSSPTPNLSYISRAYELCRYWT